MTSSPRQDIAAIDQAIARLMARKHAMEEAGTGPWPRRLTLSVYCSKDTNWEDGETLGLTGEALRLFVHFEEVELAVLAVEVAEDGIVTVLACTGKALNSGTPEEEKS